jgi:hypothetical protein
MKEFFTPEDFNGHDGTDNDVFWNRMAASAANEKLNKLIDSCPVVYGQGEQAGKSSLWNMNKQQNSTHSARIVFIEELPKEPCKHEPADCWIGPSTVDWFKKCKHCGVELVATWEAKK